ncbi:ribosome recycling factor [Candidatus Cyanaurora vandensis]|uniref:ribosome recycling factor n=1 Tax=Candidatus Cyanaurora vandensis TaxID=2714958 RepID=UPI00257F83D0|nr:ribosome recycling factor [Candidatus Cyanaurora vandensis]
MDVKEVEDKMKKAIEATRNNFNSIRTGRASASLLDRITVEYYGVPTALKSLATVSTPDAMTLLIQPFDRSSAKGIEKAIAESDLGLTPNNDSGSIRLNIPPLTQERRKSLVKLAQGLTEDGRIAIRNIRRDAIDGLRRDKSLSEDQVRDTQATVQKLTDKYIEQVDKLAAEKEKDIMSV